VNVDLRAKVSKVIQQFDADLRGKKITASNNVPEGIEVWADRNQLQIVFRNLLANAIKFTKENGTINISAKYNSPTVQILVSDTGVGMTSDRVGKLFHADQLQTTLGTNKEKGSGIGLLITKELVTNNDGSIQVESAPNKGTTFIVTLPAKK